VFVKLHVCGEVDGFFTFLRIDNLVSLKKDPIDPDQMVILILECLSPLIKCRELSITKSVSLLPFFETKLLLVSICAISKIQHCA
jgi:hypothetical protein